MKWLGNFFLAALLLLAFPSQAQLMRTLNDVRKLKDQQTRFIHKPLKKLLKEIGPEIRMASAQSKRPDNLPSYLIFKFVDAERYFAKEKTKSYTTVIVLIKENFDWDDSRSRNYTWTKEDEKKYGNVTVIGIQVIEEN